MAINVIDDLGVQPTNPTPAILYTVPASFRAVVTTLNVCNVGGATESFDIEIAKDGSNYRFWYDDVPVPANGPPFERTSAIYLPSGAKIRVLGSGSNLVFDLSGLEIST